MNILKRYWYLLVSTICQQLINLNFRISGSDVMFSSNIEQKNILGGKLTISILVCIIMHSREYCELIQILDSLIQYTKLCIKTYFVQIHAKMFYAMFLEPILRCLDSQKKNLKGMDSQRNCPESDGLFHKHSCS